MDGDLKFFMWLMVLIIVFSLTGVGVSEWLKQDCRIELARVGWFTVEEIKEICK